MDCLLVKIQNRVYSLADREIRQWKISMLERHFVQAAIDSKGKNPRIIYYKST